MSEKTEPKKTLHSEFQRRVHAYFKERHIGEILELKPASLNRHFIKFKPFSSVWFQSFRDEIDVDGVDFDKKTINGFINNNSELKK